MLINFFTIAWHNLIKNKVYSIINIRGLAIAVAMLIALWIWDNEYRTGISWQVIILSCSGALVVTLITVSFQRAKAALANPVKRL